MGLLPYSKMSLLHIAQRTGVQTQECYPNHEPQVIWACGPGAARHAWPKALTGHCLAASWHVRFSGVSIEFPCENPTAQPHCASLPPLSMPGTERAGTPPPMLATGEATNNSGPEIIEKRSLTPTPDLNAEAVRQNMMEHSFELI